MQFVYLKTVKTGSTSTEVALQPYCMPGNVKVEEIPEWHSKEIISPQGIVGARGPEAHKHNTFFNHMNASKIRLALGDEIWNNYLKVANVRNPWAKTISHFFYAGLPSGLDRDSTPKAQMKELASQFALERSVPLVEHFEGSEDSTDYFFIKFERLEQDFSYLLEKLKIQKSVSLPRFKSGLSPSWYRDYSDLYTPEARDHIGQIYESWTSTFGYRF